MLCKTQSQVLKNKIFEMQEIQISKSIALVLCIAKQPTNLDNVITTAKNIKMYTTCYSEIEYMKN